MKIGDIVLYKSKSRSEQGIMTILGNRSYYSVSASNVLFSNKDAAKIKDLPYDQYEYVVIA